MNHKCRGVQFKIWARCAGLVVFTYKEWVSNIKCDVCSAASFADKYGHPETCNIFSLNQEELLRYFKRDTKTSPCDDRHLVEFARRGVVVNFIHRTAPDFLTTTSEGHAIIAYQSLDTHDYAYRTIRAALVCRAWSKTESTLGHYMAPLAKGQLSVDQEISLLRLNAKDETKTLLPPTPLASEIIPAALLHRLAACSP
jgi:hypothetical protein